MVPISGKYVNVIPSVAAVNNANCVGIAIDTLGYDYCKLVVALGVSSTSGISALKVQESDFANMSGAADVTGLIYGTSAGLAGTTSVLPVHTDDNKIFAFEFNTLARKRYLKPLVTVDNAGTGCFVAAYAELVRAEQAPETATLKGVADTLRI